jgi:hypothetical protein
MSAGKLGSGVFTGLPISLNGARIIMENMDWGGDQQIVGTQLFFGEVGGCLCCLGVWMCIW